MTTYAQRTGRVADFRIRYQWRSPEAGEPYQRPFQHMRSDFLYDGDDLQTDGLHIIWPEFEDSTRAPLAEGAEVPSTGYASMWILFEERRPYHRARLAPGVRGFLMAGPHKIADVEVVELLGLQQ